MKRKGAGVIFKTTTLVIAMAAAGAWALAVRPGLAAPAAKPVVIKARDFAFDPRELSLRPGELVFEIKNEGSIEHNFVIEDANKKQVGQIAVIDSGKSEDVKVTLRPGSYQFLCSLPGHREAGMSGTAKVGP